MPRRASSARDRRGRGRRGPLALPGPLATDGPPLVSTRAATFDDLVLAGVERIATRWQSDLDAVEFGVEDVPLVVPQHGRAAVPLAAVHVGARGEPNRIVVFRRPIEARARSPEDLADLVYDVLVDKVAELLGRSPEDLDPG